MTIEFKGKTNSEDVYINTARFALPDGRELTIDRLETYWSAKNGNLDMEWRCCHIWDESGENYNIPDDFANAKLLDVEIEDEAPTDYTVEITEWWCWE